jgi:hypothetical protein
LPGRILSRQHEGVNISLTLLGVSDEVEAVLKQRSQHGEHGLRPAFEIRRHVGVSAGEHVEAIGAPNLARR